MMMIAIEIVFEMMRKELLSMLAPLLDSFDPFYSRMMMMTMKRKCSILNALSAL